MLWFGMERKTAIERGLKRYFTGKACKHGHLADRITVSGACSVCANLLNIADRKRAQDAINARREAETAE